MKLLAGSLLVLPFVGVLLGGLLRPHALRNVTPDVTGAFSSGPSPCWSAHADGSVTTGASFARNYPLPPGPYPRGWRPGGGVVDASEGFSKLSADLLACRKAMEACEEELPACPTRVRTALMTSYEAAVLAQHTLMASRERERELVEEVETRRQEGGAFREQLMAARRKATRLARDAEKGRPHAAVAVDASDAVG